MTFPLVKPAGWADATDDITALQASTLDANLSSALDGFAGGSCAPSAALQIAGAGLQSTNCINHNVRGNYSLNHAEARIGYRVDRTTLDPSASTTFTLDSSQDVYIAAAPCLSTVTVTLNTNSASYERAYEGARLIVRKHVNLPPAAQTDNSAMHFYTQAGILLGTLKALTALVVPMGNPYYSVEFVFDSIAGEWAVIDADQQFQKL